LPAYTNYITSGKTSEATAGLSDARLRMEQFYQDHRSYDNTGDGTAVLTFVSSTDFDFNLTSVAATTYTVTATGKGSMAGFSYTINEANNKATTATPAWNTSTTCWITKQGMSC
jgi:type IV pilus assembly protein PilE